MENNFNHSEEYSFEYLLQYAKNKLSEEENNAIEAAVEQDEILADTIEGIQLMLLEGEKIPSIKPLYEEVVLANPKKEYPPAKKGSIWLFPMLGLTMAAAIAFLFCAWPVLFNNNTYASLADQYFDQPKYLDHTRGTPNTTLSEGYLLYNKKKYHKAINLLENICDTSNPKACFYLGLALYQVKPTQLEEAENAFDLISIEADLHNKGRFYKSLCLLKMNRITEARAIWESIGNSEFKYHQAQELLDDTSSSN